MSGPRESPTTTHSAVVFDMDGVIVDSERYWQALEAEDILPAAVAVEDSGHGVASARAAGLTVVGYAADPDTGQDLTMATAVAGSPAALRATLLDLVGVS